MTTDAESYAKSLWLGLRDDGSAAATFRAYGALLALKAVGALSADQAELWEARLDRCPGHDAARVWCAYCGEICRYCGLSYGGGVTRCQDLNHCVGCCRLSLQDDDGCGGSGEEAQP